MLGIKEQLSVLQINHVLWYFTCYMSDGTKRMDNLKMCEDLLRIDEIIPQTSNQDTVQASGMVLEVDNSNSEAVKPYGRNKTLIKFIPQSSTQKILQESDMIVEVDRANSEVVKPCGKSENLIKCAPQCSFQEILQVSDVVLEVGKPNTEDVKPRGKNRNFVKSCPVCSKLMRSDHIKRHLQRHDILAKSKYPKVSCKICGKSMIRNHLSRHMKVHNIVQKGDQPIPESSDGVLKRVYNNQKVFEQKLSLGDRVHRILLDGNVEPMSLSKDDREALELFECYNTEVQITSALRPWQKTLIEIMDVPTEREILWVVGEVGGEGKTWFQKYVEHHFGTRRVFRSSIANGPSLLHTMSKRMLACVDIFLINVPKSFGVGFVPYNVLEEIKDGRAISSKYDSKTMTFHTPNVLVVFSNKQPRKQHVSKDRWKILTIDMYTDDLKSTC